MALYGTDQSNWQANSILEGDFGIFKATEGTGYVDPSCDAKYQNHKKAGKLLGVYHFARPDLCDAVKEAEFFVKNIKGYIGEAILVLDWEKGNLADTAYAKRWLDRVYELTGVRPLLYASASAINAYNWSAVAKDYGLWIAGYPNKYNVANPPRPTTANMPYKIGAWKFWAIWQYTSSAGTLDRNIANMDATAWHKYAGAKEQQPEIKPAPTPNPTPAPEEPAKEEPAKEAPTQEEQTPEQPESTDKGLTVEEYNALIDKAEQTVELAQSAAKKFGVSIPMSNKTYDALKVIVTTVLPLISFVYVGLANIWGFGFGDQVDATIQLIISAVNALLGIAIVKSSKDYHKGDA